MMGGVHLDLSYSRITQQKLNQIQYYLSRNKKLIDFRLNLTGCEIDNFEIDEYLQPQIFDQILILRLALMENKIEYIFSH